ncbi:MAG: hypothetical protein U9N76_05975 [Candidatus Marinimicrobia bacterium]|nr:hypothetical protein [Candidatus Neomarinimicrobiota bacterium]
MKFICTFQKIQLVGNINLCHICWKVGIDEIKKRNYDFDIKNSTKKEEAIIYNSAELMQMLKTSFITGSDLLNKLKKAVK